MTHHFSRLEKLETISLLNTCAINLDKGDSFPLELSVDTDIIEIADRKIEIVANISKDATEWAPINDIKAIKKIFGSKGGTISFGMGMGTKEGLWSFFVVQQVK